MFCYYYFLVEQKKEAHRNSASLNISHTQPLTEIIVDNDDGYDDALY